MADGPDISRLSALIGDPARANMLAALSGGMALTAGELAREAGVAPQTASAHLGKLTEAGLIAIEKQGRHRYARLADARAGALVESLMAFAGPRPTRTRAGPREVGLRRARVCYDHIAGELGVRLLDEMVAGGVLRRSDEAIRLSSRGRERLRRMGLPVARLEAARRPLCRACLDWSERRHHLAGALGAAILDMALQRGWLRRHRSGRALTTWPDKTGEMLAALAR